MTNPSEFAPLLALLVDWEVEPDGERRRRAARSLIRAVSAALASGHEMPPELQRWLAKCLRQASSTGDANAAFKLSQGQGRHADYLTHMHRAAQLHTVMQWRACGRYAAADEVAALPGRPDASNLVKSLARTARMWTSAGPYLIDAEQQPTLQLAEPAQVQGGAVAAVVFTSLLTDSYRITLLLPQDIGDAAPA